MPAESILPVALIAAGFVIFMLVLAFGRAQAPGPGWGKPTDRA